MKAFYKKEEVNRVSRKFSIQRGQPWLILYFKLSKLYTVTWRQSKYSINLNYEIMFEGHMAKQRLL